VTAVISVRVTTWFLQMTDPARLPEAPVADPALEVRRAELPSPELSRMLYAGVGADWYWTDRLSWTWERWHAWLARDELETWVAYVRGTPAGFFELERDGVAVEIASFGLLPAFIGRGIGTRLLDRAIRRGWELAPRRIWVHTCSLDGPAAVRTYQGRGLEIYD
jgi:GNAT superfamily N-acetyltransferase